VIVEVLEAAIRGEVFVSTFLQLHGAPSLERFPLSFPL
jgi:hypothetical protein